MTNSEAYGLNSTGSTVPIRKEGIAHISFSNGVQSDQALSLVGGPRQTKIITNSSSVNSQSSFS